MVLEIAQMSEYTEEELCVTIDYINSFECFKAHMGGIGGRGRVKSFQDLLDGWHLQIIFYEL